MIQKFVAANPLQLLSAIVVDALLEAISRRFQQAHY